MLEGCLVLLAAVAGKDENDAAANKDNKAIETLHGVLIVSAFLKDFLETKLKVKWLEMSRECQTNITIFALQYQCRF